MMPGFVHLGGLTGFLDKEAKTLHLDANLTSVGFADGQVTLKTSVVSTVPCRNPVALAWTKHPVVHFQKLAQSDLQQADHKIQELLGNQNNHYWRSLSLTRWVEA